MNPITMNKKANYDLSPAFLQQMQQLLGDHFDAFLAAYNELPFRGIRFRDIRRPLPQEDLLGDIAYTPNACYLSAASLAGATPLHEAGAFYIQEPSAMAAAAALAPKDGDCVLDLCAAPGGKSTQLAMSAKLKLLVANEPIPNRAQILSRNIERMGVANAIVTSAYPAALAAKWPGYFDKILVDAPCSGEGMFRKHPEARSEWNPSSPAHCAERQLDILHSAALMLRSGGRMTYSTCTFNSTENEGVIEAFLRTHPSFHLVPFALPSLPPAPQGMLRLWPHEVHGEGHFVALLEKEGDDKPLNSTASLPPVESKSAQAVAAFFADSGCEEALVPKTLFGGRPVILPDHYPNLNGIRILRAGLHLGEFKGKAFIPDHAVALSKPYRETIELDDRQVLDYLHGDLIPCSDSLKGFVVLSYQGYQIGFGKASGGMIKNHYPKGLRK